MNAFKSLKSRSMQGGSKEVQNGLLAPSWISGLASVSNPLHILEENLLTAAVIEFRGSAIGVAGDSLSSLKGTVIFQKIRDAGRPK
jgi:hypothetical protein